MIAIPPSNLRNAILEDDHRRLAHYAVQFDVHKHKGWNLHRLEKFYKFFGFFS